jgi:hypothetical protein
MVPGLTTYRYWVDGTVTLVDHQHLTFTMNDAAYLTKGLVIRFVPTTITPPGCA